MRRGTLATRTARIRVVTPAWLFLVLAASVGAAESRPAVLEALAYAGGADPQQSLDLYLPAAPDAASVAPPLLVFVHSRFFDRADRGVELARDFARPLQRAGAAVAIVRHRLAPEHPHPAAVSDVAAGVAFLLAGAERFGFDPGRVYLAGRSSGALLAALVALDPSWLAAHDLTPDALAGVAVVSGIYDLAPVGEGAGALSEEERRLYAQAFGNTEERRRASPIHRVRAEGPLFVAMVAQNDIPGAYDSAFAFTEALREAGHPAAETFAVGGRDHFSILDLRDTKNPARRHFLSLLELDPELGSMRDLLAMRRHWRNPTQSTSGFWEAGLEVTARDSDADFLRVLNLMFAKPGRPTLLRPERYHAIDLFAWLDWLGDRAGRGDWLVLTNARDERVVWRLDEIRPLRPVVVIGLDDERQLFRVTDVYHTRRRRTWTREADQVWLLARPLGAFIHFLEPLPETLDPRGIGRFALEPDAFTLAERDPLEPLRGLPTPERTLVTESLRCVGCHSLQGVGTRAGHLRAADGALVGGFAGPLEAYPAPVWSRFCFEQAAVAREIGATPIQFAPGDAKRLHDLVVAIRDSDG